MESRTRQGTTILGSTDSRYADGASHFIEVSLQCIFLIVPYYQYIYLKVLLNKKKCLPSLMNEVQFNL